MTASNGITFSVGDRVQVSPEYHWAQGAMGVIASPIHEILQLTPDRQESRRSVLSRIGTITFYWVDFDEPQIDADGDGPYGGAEIDARFLKVVYRAS